ncbi:hypothetical protein SEUCBS139899_005222 [Sporothrix eucalyptigena]
MDPRFHYAAPSGRRSPPLHNPARASMPVNIGSSYPSVYGADPHASQPHVSTRYDDPITPRTQTTVDYRAAPAVPTPPQLHKTQQPPVTAAAASTSAAGQPAHASHPSHHQHQHASQDPTQHHHHHTQHQPSMPPPPPPTTTTRTYTVNKDPIGRGTSLREPPRAHRSSFNETAQKRPIIITTTTGAGSAAASNSTATSRGPPSPTRADHFRPPSAEPARGSSMRDDNYYYSMPAASATLRSRGARYSYSGAPMSATLDNDELHRLRERHDAIHSGPRVDSFPRSRPMSAYVNIPRHSSALIPGPGATGSIASGAGSASLSSTLVGSVAGSGANSYGDQGYEYTKPSDLARYDLTHEQAGPRRGRRDSFDRNYYRPTVNLTTEVGRPYGYDSGPRRSAGGSSAAGSSGPPPTTWGLDKINRNVTGGSLASSTTAPVGYDSVTSIRAPVIHAATMPVEHTHRPEGSSSVRTSSRQRMSALYPPDDYYRGRDDDGSRDRRGGDRDRDRDYRDRDYRDRERVRGSREYYADGSTANRAFGILVNSRDHQLRQEQAPSGTVAVAGGPYYDDYRATYADDGPHRERANSRTEYGGGRYNGIDREFVRGRPGPTERLGIESPKRKETDDDMYVHHPQEGMRQWERDDRYEHEGSYEHERERERIPRDPRDSRDPRGYHDPRDPRDPRDARDSRDSRRERIRESERDHDPREHELEHDAEREREREHNRERERERARDREREHERERERQRAHERDRDQEYERDRDRDQDRNRAHGDDYDSRPSRRTGDEEVANTKKSRDKASTGLGVAAATAAAAAAAIAASSDEPSGHTVGKSSRDSNVDRASGHDEPSRRERDRKSDGSPHSADSRERESRRRPSKYDNDSGSEASYGSKTSAYTIPAPVLAPAPAHGDLDAEGQVRTHPVDRTPSTSEDGDSDKGSKEPGPRRKRQHNTAASFVPTNTEDLMALKAELAALEAKEAREGKSSRKTKDADDKPPRDDDAIDPPRGKSSGKSSKTDKGEASSPSILTPSSTLSSAPPSPKQRPTGDADGVLAASAGVVAAAAASSKGKGKEKETYRHDVPDRSPDRSSRVPEIVPEPHEEADSRRGRDQSQPPSKGLVVRLVSPPREKEEKRPVKSILKAPKDKFPEEANPIREGVAPHKDDKTKQQGVPPGARWTRISRKLVNPEALTIGKERFEVRDDFVIVLRVLGREEIEAYTIATAQIRDQHRKEHERSTRHHDDKEKDKSDDKDRDETKADDERRHHRSRRDRERDRDRDRDRERDRDRDRDDHDDDYYGGGGSTKDRHQRHHRYGSETYADDAVDSRQPAIEYHSSRGSNRQYHRK